MVGQAITQKLTMPPAAEDATPAMKRTQAILKYTPLMIGFFSIQVPAALCIYWFTSNLFTSMTTLAIKRYWELNPPKIGANIRFFFGMYSSTDSFFTFL